MWLDYGMFHEKRDYFRVPYLFSFHNQGDVFKGINFSRNGFGIYFSERNEGNFHFHRSQLLRDSYMQIEGKTIYFSRLRVSRLDISKNGLIYGFRIESIIEPEMIKYLSIYERALDSYRNSETLSIAEKQALDEFYAT